MDGSGPDAASRELLARFKGPGGFTSSQPESRRRGAERCWIAAAVQAVIRVLPGFERDLTRGPNAGGPGAGRTAANSNTASLVASYASSDRELLSAESAGGQQNMRLLARSPSAAQ